MTTISGNKIDFKLPIQLTKTIAQAQNSLADRGMGLTSTIIKIATESSKEEITKASEAEAHRLLGNKVDTVA